VLYGFSLFQFFLVSVIVISFFFSFSISGLLSLPQPSVSWFLLYFLLFSVPCETFLELFFSLWARLNRQLASHFSVQIIYCIVFQWNRTIHVTCRRCYRLHSVVHTEHTPAVSRRAANLTQRQLVTIGQQLRRMSYTYVCHIDHSSTATIPTNTTQNRCRFRQGLYRCIPVVLASTTDNANGSDKDCDISK